MKKWILTALCALLTMSLLGCVLPDPERIGEQITERAEDIVEFGEDVFELTENIGEGFGELGERFGESFGELGEHLGESFTEFGEQIGENMAGLSNPFVTYQTLSDAEQAVGFSIELPDEDWYTRAGIQVMRGKMLQVRCPSDEGNGAVIRKQAGEADISGDYNEYTDVQTVTIGDVPVTLKGNNGMVSTAIWTANGFSYAVLYEEPHTVEQACKLIEQIH